MSVQFINDADGRAQFAVVPAAEYESLVARARTPLTGSSQTGPLVGVPDAVMSAVRRGMSPIKAWRTYLGLERGGVFLSQGETASALGVTSAYLSMIESGATPVTPARLKDIATLMDIPLQALMGGYPRATYKTFGIEDEAAVSIIRHISAGGALVLCGKETTQTAMMMEAVLHSVSHLGHITVLDRDQDIEIDLLSSATAVRSPTFFARSDEILDGILAVHCAENYAGMDLGLIRGAVRERFRRGGVIASYAGDFEEEDALQHFINALGMTGRSVLYIEYASGKFVNQSLRQVA